MRQLRKWGPVPAPAAASASRRFGGAAAPTLQQQQEAVTGGPGNSAAYGQQGSLAGQRPAPGHGSCARRRASACLAAEAQQDGWHRHPSSSSRKASSWRWTQSPSSPRLTHVTAAAGSESRNPWWLGHVPRRWSMKPSLPVSHTSPPPVSTSLLLLQGASPHVRLPHPHAEQDGSPCAEAAPQEGPQEPVPCQHTLISRQEAVTRRRSFTYTQAAQHM